MRRALLALTLALGGGALAAASCAVPGFELVDAQPSAGGAGVGGGGGAGASGGASGCQHASWPQPPAADDPSSGDVDFVAAVYEVDFGESDLSQGPRIGYDLDNVCTCQGQGHSCELPAYADETLCDGPNGIDNNVSQLFSVLSSFAGTFSSSAESMQAQQGSWTLLIRVSEYNGQPNDTQVKVSLHPSPGLDQDTCLSDSTPRWDGSDAWPVDSISLEPLGGGGGGGAGGGAGGGSCGGIGGFDVDQPKFFDDQAYVSGGTLVANLPAAGLLLSSNDAVVSISLVAGFLTAKLSQEQGMWHMKEAVLTGRWRLPDFFAMVGTIQANNMPLCTNHLAYPLLKNAVCQYPDIASTQGANPPCDAMSFGMGFEARPAQFGIVYPSGGNTMSLCPPTTDPANDSCG